MTSPNIRRLGGLAMRQRCVDTAEVERGQPPRPQTPRSRKVPRRCAVSEMTASRCTGGYRMDLLDRLLGHDHWTTARLLELSRDLTDAHLDQPIDIGHQTLRETFDHMI